MFFSTQKVTMLLCPYNRVHNMWPIFPRGIIKVPSDLNLAFRHHTGKALFCFSFHLCACVSLYCSSAEPVHSAHLCFFKDPSSISIS